MANVTNKLPPPSQKPALSQHGDKPSAVRGGCCIGATKWSPPDGVSASEPGNMWAPLITSDCATAPFTEASVHLSNKDQSAHISIPARLSLESSSLCRWALLLRRDCRCDLGQLCRRRALIDIPHPSHNCMIQQCPQVQMQRAVW